MLLIINLRYCRASEGVLIHRPNLAGNPPLSLVNRLQKAIEGILDDSGEDDVYSIVLTDTVGQKLRLNVENTQGGGGQRHVVVYCPYWVVNTSQYAFRVREEGEMEQTAGSVTTQR
ncbi:hypothetical protein EON65_18005 [archaeon]|nr:MAG: hypothetical protein EON65_18005 [archaeon]